MKLHTKDITEAQEYRTWVYKQGILLKPLALLIEGGDSCAHVNHMRGLELDQPKC